MHSVIGGVILVSLHGNDTIRLSSNRPVCDSVDFMANGVISSNYDSGLSCNFKLQVLFASRILIQNF